jgi:hypothetical protein
MPLGKATSISAYAYLAEVLPLPGGAIVRFGALMDAGGNVRNSASLVLLTAVLWIALAFVGAGIAMWSQSRHLAWPLLIIGTICAAGTGGWLWRFAGPLITTQTILHRLIGIALIGLRLKFAFAALGTTIAFSETFPFVLTMLLGSASLVAPSGLGVSEALAALIATTVSYSPNVAFLATGIDRFFCLTGCAILAVITLTARPLRTTEQRPLVAHKEE